MIMGKAVSRRGAAVGLAVAATAGLVIVAGAATTALWRTEVQVGGFRIDSGDIQLQLCPRDEFTPRWNEEKAASPASGHEFEFLKQYKGMPGDELTMTYCVEAELKGDDLAASFEVNWDLADFSDDLATYQLELDTLRINPAASTWTMTQISPLGAGWQSTPTMAGAQIGESAAVAITSAIDRTNGWDPGDSEERWVRWEIKVSLVYQHLAANVPDLKANAKGRALPEVASSFDEAIVRPSEKVIVPAFTVAANQVRAGTGSGFE
ncbi:MAG: hypothetical protein FWD59_08970 [Micrococcales bacterium]|nr:hypothetical protein [Micrococcales bacterium]